MNEQEILDLFQTSLYFFSALLQADAAILGFGTIFIIFKLQSLDSLKQKIIQMYYTKGPGHIGNINMLLFSKNSKDIAEVLSNTINDKYDFENYSHIVCLPEKIKKISNSIKFPICLIGSHAVICAVFLVISQFLYTIVIIQILLLTIVLIWFGFGIFITSKLAISLLTKSDDINLGNLLPEVYNLIQANNK